MDFEPHTPSRVEQQATDLTPRCKILHGVVPMALSHGSQQPSSTLEPHPHPLTPTYTGHRGHLSSGRRRLVMPASLYLNSGLSQASGGGSKVKNARTRKSGACIHDLTWPAVHETKVIFDWWDLVRRQLAARNSPLWLPTILPVVRRREG